MTSRVRMAWVVWLWGTPLGCRMAQTYGVKKLFSRFRQQCGAVTMIPLRGRVIPVAYVELR